MVLNGVVLKPALLTIVLFSTFMVFQNMYISILSVVIYFLAVCILVDKDDRKKHFKLSEELCIANFDTSAGKKESNRF